MSESEDEYEYSEDEENEDLNPDDGDLKVSALYCIFKSF